MCGVSERRDRSEAQLPIADQSHGVMLLYSSGTTGRPKGVKRQLSPRPWEEDEPAYRSQRERYGFDANTVNLSTAPLYHAAPFGFSMCVTRYGGACVIMEHFGAEQALILLERHRVTHSQWVPTMFVRMLKLPQATRARYDLSSHQLAIHAAAPCPVAVKEQMIDWWGEYYGGTEGNGSTAITPAEWLSHKGSVGRAAGGCSIHIPACGFTAY